MAVIFAVLHCCRFCDNLAFHPTVFCRVSRFSGLFSANQRRRPCVCVQVQRALAFVHERPPEQAQPRRMWTHSRRVPLSEKLRPGPVLDPATMLCILCSFFVLVCELLQGGLESEETSCGKRILQVHTSEGFF